MTNVVVIGAQWGDEGKGKIVDWLARHARFIVRFQGGHNAGHTLVVEDKIYKLSILPSGILWPDKKVVLGGGLVLDPYHLKEEMAFLSKMGVVLTRENIKIAETIPLVLSLHRELDVYRETDMTPHQALGTTCRGIGPAYEDKVGRRSIRVIDLADESKLPQKVERLLRHHNPLRRGLGLEPVSGDNLVEELKRIRMDILPFVASVPDILHDAHRLGEPILFEGAQGAMLDIEYGTYPFVTSSSTFAANAALGTGLPMRDLHYVVGVVKAYTTRVGTGPFPTELEDSTGVHLRQKGHEVGTVTGRSRRCGWLDTVALRYIIRLNGIKGVALTKLDVMAGLSEVKICTAYQLEGELISTFPSAIDTQYKIKPVYETLPGWEEMDKNPSSFEALSSGAQAYIKRLEEILEIPVIMVSTGAERAQTLVRCNPFE